MGILAISPGLVLAFGNPVSSLTANEAVFQQVGVEIADNPLGLLKFVVDLVEAVDVVVEIAAQIGDRLKHFPADMQITVIGLEGLDDQIPDHCADPAGMALADDILDLLGQVAFFDDPGPQGVIKVMIDIGDDVGEADYLAFQGAGQFGFILGNDIVIAFGMADDTVTDLEGEIEALAIVFEEVNNPQAMEVVFKSTRMQLVEGGFAGMAKRGVTEIVAEGDGLSQGFVETEGRGDGPGDLGHLQHMGQSGAVMIASRGEKDLGFVFETAEGLGVGDPVAVTLKGQADIADIFLFLDHSALGSFVQAGIGGENLFFPVFELLFDRFTDDRYISHFSPLLDAIRRSAEIFPQVLVFASVYLTIRLYAKSSNNLGP